MANGSPVSHKADKFLELIQIVDISKLKEKAETYVFRGSFELPEDYKKASINWFYNSIATNQNLYLNGVLLAKKPGEIILKAQARGLKAGTVKICAAK